jgi:hypothetical protein
MRDAVFNIERNLTSGQGPLCDAFSKVATAPLKVAAVDDSVYESADDARNRRIAELLKRRQPSGLSTGSASPTPPRDSA